jgi:formylglycine-generating enzyme required for sulfatase activity
MRFAWLVPVIAFGASACFPDYSVKETPGLEDGMVRIASNGETFEFQIGDHETGDMFPGSVEFDYDFDIDAYEVTVARYRTWVDLGYPNPCGDQTSGCALDGGSGPYEDEIRWNPVWNPRLSVDDSQYTKDQNCFGVGQGNYGSTTYMLPDNDDFPMTCVTWYLAAAFCGWEGKRLPTESEWLYVASSHGAFQYAWGNDTQVGCDQATVNGCPFPVGVYDGTKPTVDGVYGMGDSVFEWTWDASWVDPDDWPIDESDFEGPDADEADPGHGRMRDGGAYWLPLTEPRLRNDKFEAYRAATDSFDDAGFRCVRSVR